MRRMMRLPRALLAALLPVLAVLAGSCGQNDPDASTNVSLPTTALPFLGASGPNVVKVQIGGTSLCGTAGYFNEPCASATVCVPGTGQCQTITDLLVDTGSVGLRV